MSFSYKHLTVNSGVACGEQNVPKSKQSPLHMRVTCPLCQAKGNLKPLDDIMMEVLNDAHRIHDVMEHIASLQASAAVAASFTAQDIHLFVGTQEVMCGPTGDDMFCACGCGGDDSRCDYWTRCYAFGQNTADTHTCCKVFYTTAEVAERLGLVDPSS